MKNLMDTLLSGLRPYAEDVGLKLNGKDLWRQQDVVLVSAKYQGSVSSSRDRLRFTVNLEVYALPLLELPWKRSEPHWSERIGYMLPEQDDLWWVATKGSIVHAIETQGKLIHEHIDPLLVRTGNMRYLERVWRTGESGYLSPMVRAELLAEATAAGLV